MLYNKFFTWVCIAILFCSCKGGAHTILLVEKGTSDYKIILPVKPMPIEEKSAAVLKNYIKKITGYDLPIIKEGKKKETGIYIGQTKQAYKIHAWKFQPESYLIQTEDDNLIIAGGSGKGVLYGVYSFIEKYLGCKKYAQDSAIFQKSEFISIPGVIQEEVSPAFIYREDYYPAAHDPEYMQWNKLHSLEDLWAIWGHSFNKLVPAKQWFESHPEFYALVKGKRQATQLCLSNEEVFKISVEVIKRKIADNPDAMYVSVSPNDDNGYCECDKCKAVDEQEGGPQGSLIKFVNRIAKEFPDKRITTLAYGYTHRAPKTLKPAGNVYVFLSDIDAFRDKPIAEEGTAAGFRKDLKDWKALTPNLFVWDYVTEFTNYLAPFPNFQTLHANINYFKDNGVVGIFSQGSGDTYGEFAELRSYLIGKMMWDTKVDLKALTDQFLIDYYGQGAATYLVQYMDLLQVKLKESKHKLDIYGNPVNEFNTYLSPVLIEKYAELFDKAEAASEANPVYLQRVARCRLPIEYTVLQQAKFYGIERHGIFIKDDNGDWIVKPKFKEKVEKFVAICKKAGVTELSEGGLKPDQYMEEWQTIFTKGVTPTKAVGANVTLKYPPAGDYPAKGNKTLTDGNPGYNDFSYNWLCFYGTPMEATVDLGKQETFGNIKMHFLDDPRHWIFKPENITIEISKTGADYHTVSKLNIPTEEEHYDCSVQEFNLPVKMNKKETARFIKVTANNLDSLPVWRQRDNKKPMIACDEIFVQ